MTLKEKSWIMVDVGNSAYSIIITTAIFPLFFKESIAGGLSSSLSTAYWSYANTIACVLAAVLAPLFGTIADYPGNKKKFFILFTLMGCLSAGLLFFSLDLGYFYALLIYVISFFGFQISSLFYDALLVDVVAKKKMDWLSSVGYAWGYIGSVIPFVFSILIILKPGWIGFASSEQSIPFSFLIAAFWWLLFSLPLIKNVKQVYFEEKVASPLRESFKRIFKTVKNIKKYRNIFLFLLAYFFYIDGVDTIIKMAVIFGKDLNISANNLIIILLVVQLLSFPFAILFGKLSKIFSAKKLLLIGIGIYIVITINAFMMQTVFDYWILACLVAAVQGGVQSLSRSFFARMIPEKDSGEFFGFYNIFGKFSAFLGPLMIGILSQITRDPKAAVLSLLVLFLAGGIILLFVKEERVCV